MKKILVLIIFSFSVFMNALALELNVIDVTIKGRNVYFSFTIVVEEEIYLTNLKDCYYKIEDDCLFIYFQQFMFPNTYSCDFPSIIGDKILNKNISLKNKKIKLKSMSNIPFTENKNTPDLSNIKKIVFSIGYISNGDYKIICCADNNFAQRDKFFYVLENQEILLKEVDIN